MHPPLLIAALIKVAADRGTGRGRAGPQMDVAVRHHYRRRPPLKLLQSERIWDTKTDTEGPTPKGQL